MEEHETPKEQIVNEDAIRIETVVNDEIHLKGGYRMREGDIIMKDGKRWQARGVTMGLKLGRSGYLRCPYCQGRVCRLNGEGLGLCPYCGEPSLYEPPKGDKNFEDFGRLVKVEEIRAAFNDGLTPMDRRLAPIFGNTPEDLKRVKNQE